MQKQSVVLLLVALVAVAAGAFFFLGSGGAAPAPVMQWDTADEVDGADEEQAEAGETETAAFERTEVEATTQVAAVGDEPRVDAILRGRVVDKFAAPVAGAKVWLEIGRSRQQGGRAEGRGGRGGRGGRSRRIPEPVVTNADGLFAFRGEAFRNLRVSLQVKSDQHAVGLFEKDVGDIRAGAAAAAEVEVALGDLQLKSGGLVRGRVTDLDGNGVGGAEVTVEPDWRNRLRFQRNRRELMPATTTDVNGYYSYGNVSEGRYAVSVLAKRHTPGRSETFEVAEDAVVEVPDIALGPGYEITGIVRDASGAPIAEANVRMRASLSENARRDGGRDQERRGRGGRGGFRGAFRGGFDGWDHRTETDAEGRFFLEHLPSALLEMKVDADGFLDFEADDIDPKLNQPIDVTLQPGLYIAGLVQTPDGLPLTTYSVEARRLRDLPDPNMPEVDFNELMTKMRDPDLSQADRDQLMRQMRSMRDRFAGQFGGRGRGSDRGGRGGDRGGRGERGGERQEEHPGGRFRIDGLQEGVYEVLVEADDWARYRSVEVEVRSAAPQPNLTVTMDRGHYVGGAVVDTYGDPIADARVSLRTAQLDDGAAMQAPSGGRGGRGGFDFNRMVRDWTRGMSGPTLRLEGRTDEDGTFIIKNVPTGVYSLSGSADGFAQGSIEAFQLDRDRSDFEMRLEPLGIIAGTVTGFLPEEAGDVQVVALQIPEDGDVMGSIMRGGMRGFGGRGGRGGRGGGSETFRLVKIEADGSYRIEGLSSGAYCVRSATGGYGEIFRMFGQKAMDGSLQPDVDVRPGTIARWDLQLTRPQVGVVTGTVAHNGENAAGFRVELRRQDDGTGQSQAQSQRGGMFGRMASWGRSQSDTVKKDGSFTIKNVNAGLYNLRITASRRGGVLYEEPVQVLADATVERTFVLTTGSVKGTVTTNDGADPKSIGGSVSLIRDAVEPPEDLRRFLRENSAFTSRVRDGAFEVTAIPTGTYLLVYQPRGRARTTQTLVVSGAEEITVLAGQAEPQNNGAPK